MFQPTLEVQLDEVRYMNENLKTKLDMLMAECDDLKLKVKYKDQVIENLKKAKAV
jgi:hypothetical protein